jgi:hypothetical protein
VALCARTTTLFGSFLALGEAQEPRKEADKKQRECFEGGGSLGLNRVVPGNQLEGLKGCGDGVEGSKKTMNWGASRMFLKSIGLDWDSNFRGPDLPGTGSIVKLNGELNLGGYDFFMHLISAKRLTQAFCLSQFSRSKAD